MEMFPPLDVLVVDGAVAAREALAAELRAQGCRPTELGDPERAADAVRQGRFHLVLLDVDAPGGRGLDWLRAVRAADPELCVICLTDRPEVRTAVATMRERAFDYLPRPLSREALGAALRAAAEENHLVADVEQRLNREVGRRVRARRQELGFTLKQVARRTGLSISLISQVELGKSAASLFTLYKLASALRVPVAGFFQEISAAVPPAGRPLTSRHPALAG